jgi:hypothetical protein
LLRGNDILRNNFELNEDPMLFRHLCETTYTIIPYCWQNRARTDIFNHYLAPVYQTGWLSANIVDRERIEPSQKHCKCFSPALEHDNPLWLLNMSKNLKQKTPEFFYSGVLSNFINMKNQNSIKPASIKISCLASHFEHFANDIIYVDRFIECFINFLQMYI